MTPHDALARLVAAVEALLGQIVETDKVLTVVVDVTNAMNAAQAALGAGASLTDPTAADLAPDRLAEFKSIVETNHTRGWFDLPLDLRLTSRELGTLITAMSASISLRARLQAVEADLDRCGQQRAADVQQMLRLQARLQAVEADLDRCGQQRAADAQQMLRLQPKEA